MQENDPIIKAYFTYKIEEEKDSTLIESTQKEMVESRIIFLHILIIFAKRYFFAFPLSFVRLCSPATIQGDARPLTLARDPRYICARL